MSLTAILLVSISAVAHATWNLLGKRSNPSTGFFALANLVGIVLLLPFPIIFRGLLPEIPTLVWIYLVITGVFQVVYFVGLSGAYRNGDMSLVYPLARSLPVILIALVTVLLGIGKPITWLGAAGILLVSAGCFILPQPSFRQIRWRSYLTPYVLWSLLAAVGTCGYTLIDSEALRTMRTQPSLGGNNFAITGVFIFFETVSTALTLLIYTALVSQERQRLVDVSRTGKIQVCITAALITGAYGLVLLAMAYASNVSYVAAFRQLSIPLGALFGIAVQKEASTTTKLVGIGSVLTGLVLVSLV